MNKKIFAIMITVVMVAAIFGVTFPITVGHSTTSETRSTGGQSTTLITEWYGNRVIEVDSVGNIIWQKTGLNEPFDAERLDNGNTLIAERAGGRVIEVDSSGGIVWQKTGLNGPTEAERLIDGNTLIVEWYGGRVIEIDNAGSILWEKTGLNLPADAERLANGNTLISNYGGYIVIEVNSAGDIVWEQNVNFPIDVERLANGNTLITELLQNRVSEVDSSGSIVWQKSGLNGPMDAERLANGNTLIAEWYSGRVIEVDSAGSIIWQKSGLRAPSDVERIEAQIIDANVEIKPNTLNLKSEGRWVTGYIDFPSGYDVNDIDLSTVKLNDSIPADRGNVQNGTTQMVKFDRSDVEDLIDVPNENEDLIVTGKISDGTDFAGNDTIRAIEPGN